MLKKHYTLIIALFIIVAAFVISRLPFFMYMPLVGYHNDTAVYFSAIEGLQNGSLPTFATVPPLYPMFLWFAGKLSGNILIYIILQTAFSFLSAVFFITVTYRYVPRATLYMSVGLSVFFMSGHSIAFDTMLLTESLYVSILIVTCALLLWALHSKSLLPLVLLSLFLALPLLIRPTGIIVFLLLGAVVIRLFFIKASIKTHVALLLPFAALLLSGMYYSYAVGNGFVPKRIQGYFIKQDVDVYALAMEDYSGDTTTYTRAEWNLLRLNTPGPTKGEAAQKVYTNPFMRLLVFFNAVSYESRPFYSNELYRRYNSFYRDNFTAKLYHNNGFNIAPFSASFKRLMFKNYIKGLPPDNFTVVADVKNNPDASLNKCFAYRIYDIFQTYIALPLFKNKLWILLTALAFAMALLKLYRTRLADKMAFFTFFTVSLLLLTALIMTFTGHNSGNWRYTYPTEFVFYMAGGMWLAQILNKDAVTRLFLFRKKTYTK